jgi:hypothetical protein
MDIGLVVFWLAVGICPDWWPFPRIPRPPVPPVPPEPPWLFVTGALGGVAGGWLQQAAFGFGQDGLTVVTVAATAVGAAVGSILVNGAIRAVRGQR